MTQTYLCVGGPLSGQRKTMRDGANGFRVAVKAEPSVVQTEKEGDIPPSPIENIHYLPREIFTNKGPIVFWVPTGQSSFETISLLMEGFEKFHMKEASNGEG